MSLHRLSHPDEMLDFAFKVIQIYEKLSEIKLLITNT